VIGTGDFTFSVWNNKMDLGAGMPGGQVLTLVLSAVVALAFIRFGSKTAAAVVRFEPKFPPKH